MAGKQFLSLKWALTLFAVLAVLSSFSVPVLCEDNQVLEAPTAVNSVNAPPQTGSMTSDDKDYEYDYGEDDEEWFYKPGGQSTDDKDGVTSSSSTTTTPMSEDKDQDEGESDEYDEDASDDYHKKVDDDKSKEVKTEFATPVYKGKEGGLGVEDAPTRKPMQAPKTTIIMYTMLIVVLIGCVVLVTVWKGSFKIFRRRPNNNTPSHIISPGEEGKRLLDHPFV